MLVRALFLSDRAARRRRGERLFAIPELLTLDSTGRRDVFERLGREHVDLLIADRAAMPGPVANFLRTVRLLPDPPDVLVLAEAEDAEERVSMLSAGADAVVSSELPDEVLRETLRAWVERRRQERLRRIGGGRLDEYPRFQRFATRTPAMEQLLATARRVAAADTSVLIVGETGVGKELFAKAIHNEGPRRDGPFVALNCAAIPEALVESELFGYEPGAFTGALHRRRGHVERAHRGTLFLDEIGELPLHPQAKLLRVLQERVVQPLGSERTLPVDVRVIAATSRDIESDRSAGRFRPDLYYRLGVVTLRIPPLRERVDDIPLLVEHYRAHFQEKLSKRVLHVTEDAMRALVAYPWPGNVRELVNVVEHAVLLTDGDTIRVADLPDIGGVAERTRHEPSMPAGWREMNWRQVREHVLAEAERAYLEGLLEATHGQVGETARRAGMDPRSVFEKMRRHRLDKKKYR